MARSLCYVLSGTLAALTLLTACSRERTHINTSQPIVMESAILSAGITANPPALSEEKGQQHATSMLYNEQEQPVTLNYRFYWYDDRGLEILPFEAIRFITVPAHSKVAIGSSIGSPAASKVRLYLYLQQGK